jgi:hypothetical protein
VPRQLVQAFYMHDRCREHKQTCAVHADELQQLVAAAPHMSPVVLGQLAQVHSTLVIYARQRWQQPVERTRHCSKHLLLLLLERCNGGSGSLLLLHDHSHVGGRSGSKLLLGRVRFAKLVIPLSTALPAR